MDEPMRLPQGLSIPRAEIHLRAARSSGPGGQHANVTASRVEASFDVAGSPTLSEPIRALLLARLGPRVSAVSQDSRSQARNRELAIARLQARLAGALRVRRPRRPTRPTRAQRSARLDAKRRRGARKRDRRVPPGDD